MSDKKTEIIGTHALMQKLAHITQKVARTDATVLITGESGTGKELVARALHEQSKRINNPFVAVNCGTIPGDLLESEMFGHQKGSFTGATEQRPGMFQLAHTGTIFLDEIGEMSHHLQVKLLRALQDREIRPVGADKSFKVDVRVVAATNKDLATEVKANRFRPDLYYRLQVVPITLPPLRERRSDIPLLIEHFLNRHNAARPFPITISEEAMVLLWEYDWHGNIRELETVIERLVILSDSPVIRPDTLPPHIRSFLSEKKIPSPSLGEDGMDLNAAVEEFENRMIDEALRRTSGNKQAAARLLGLKRTTLVAKLRRKRGPDYKTPQSYAY
ncbi:MAG: sigma-54-dependent Fis family transcriptional regulator [Myxococcales bacterium]|nr:MAG: sigma-54-dependent Fis family transcriptional regulator [Myxococcales bacterium]